MPNMDPWINQNEVTNKFENHLLSIRDERHQKIIELIDWTLEKYKDSLKKPQQYEEEQEVIIDDIIEELEKKGI